MLQSHYLTMFECSQMREGHREGHLPDGDIASALLAVVAAAAVVVDEAVTHATELLVNPVQQLHNTTIQVNKSQLISK